MGDNKTILIVGRSGNGMTSLAKSITGLQTFQIHQLDGKDLQQDPYLQIKQYDGTQYTRDTGNIRYNVLVCSCIGDNEEDAGYDYATIKSVAEKALRIGRIHAVVLALKYGVRFTKQESDAVDIVRSFFGENVLVERVIIAFSYGDIFKYDNDMEIQEAFKEWCLQQQGSIKSLFEKVNYRCVLFNNKVKDQAGSLSQLKKYIESINTDKDLKLQVVPIEQIPVNELKKKPKSQIKQLKKQHKSDIKELNKKHKRQRKLLKQRYESQVNELNDKYQIQIKALGANKQSGIEVQEREKQQKTQKHKLKEDKNSELKELKQKQQKELDDRKQQQKTLRRELKQQLKSSRGTKTTTTRI